VHQEDSHARRVRGHPRWSVTGDAQPRRRSVVHDAGALQGESEGMEGSGRTACSSCSGLRRRRARRGCASTESTTKSFGHCGEEGVGAVDSRPHGLRALERPHIAARRSFGDTHLGSGGSERHGASAARPRVSARASTEPGRGRRGALGLLAVAEGLL
jgi:hypothetical protein